MGELSRDAITEQYLRFSVSGCGFRVRKRAAVFVRKVFQKMAWSDAGPRIIGFRFLGLGL